MKNSTLIFGLSLLMAFVYTPYLLSAQNSNPYNNIIPPNPDAASLAKYADFPVDLSSGVPQIDIPLWNIKCGDINVPISLSYHASGIPVAETPSYVGLGWALNAGGVITRTIRGLADDGMEKHSGSTIITTSGILTWYPSYGIKPNSSDDQHNPLKYWEAAAGKADLEPDMFYYNFCDYSGKFVFDFNGTPHLIPRKNIQIEKELNPSNSDDYIIRWKVTSDNGLKYYFDEVEVTKQFLITDIELRGGDGGSPHDEEITSNIYHSAWFLTKIEMPNSPDAILFEYDDIVTENISPVSERKKHVTQYYATHFGIDDSWQAQEELMEKKKDFGTDTYEVTQSKSTITGKRLRKIIAPDQTVEFIPGDYRHDLKGDRVLDKVVIKDKANVVLKQFKLSYNYFSGNGMATLGVVNPNANLRTDLRLSLNRIDDFEKPPYIFEYESSVWLPDRVTSKAHDHWGYYNGEDENTSLMPYSNTSGEYLDLNIRNASRDHLKAGSLVKINYPTGGYTRFNFEANTFGNASSRLNRISAYSEVGGCVYNNTNGTFAIDDDSQSARVKVKISGNYTGSHDCSGGCNTDPISPANPNTHIHLAIEGPNGTIMLAEETAINGTMGTIDVEETRTLHNGTYRIKAVKKTQNGSFVEIDDCDSSPYNRIRLSVEGIQLKSYNVPITVGGLRIKEKIDYDPISNKSLFKQYDYNLSENTSSGYIGYVPVYSYSSSAVGGTLLEHVKFQAYYNYYTSSSNTALNNGGENIIFYEKVTVIEGNAQIGINGKTENYFTILKSFDSSPTIGNGYTSPVYVSYFPSTGPQFPFGPSISGAWGCKLINFQRIYKYKNNVYSKIKEIQNFYKNDYWGSTTSYNPETDVLAASVGVRTIDSGQLFGIGSIAVQFYFIPSRNINLVKIIETDYDDSETETTSKVTEIEYDNFSPYIYPSKTTQTLKDGDKLIEQTLYPQDYMNAGNDFIGLMKTNHILNKPIENVTYKIKDSNTLITGGGIFTYKVGDNLGRLDKVFKLQTEAPISKLDFKLSSKTTTNALAFNEGAHTSFSLGGIDSRYTGDPAITYDLYDNTGNLLQYHKEKDIYTTYIWGYNNQYLIAKIENASYTDVEESFTGRAIGYTAAWHALMTGSFVSSYSGGSPVYTSLDDPGYQYYLNLIRGDFPEARVTTYTYKPLVGMTSQTDFNGKTTFYEYDNVGRLKYMKDNDGGILKSYDYHYKKQ